MLNTKKYSILIIACLFSTSIKPNNFFFGAVYIIFDMDKKHPYICRSGAAAFITILGYVGFKVTQKKLLPLLRRTHTPTKTSDSSTLPEKDVFSSHAVHRATTLQPQMINTYDDLAGKNVKKYMSAYNEV